MNSSRSYDKLYGVNSVAYPANPAQTYTYDDAGNLATKDLSEGGSPTTSCRYTFDGANRLREATISSTPAAYWYDQDGRRVKETVNGKTTWFLYDGLSVIAEFGDDKEPDSVIVPGVSRTRLDLHEPQTEYYLLDGLGSVAQLTDELGNITQEYFYDVFGAARNVKRDPFNRYRFVGLAHDDLTGLIYMNARWYEPGTGRFVSRDAFSGCRRDTRTHNSYIYAGNNPANSIDPAGESFWDWLKSVLDMEEEEAPAAGAEEGYSAGEEPAAEGSRRPSGRATTRHKTQTEQYSECRTSCYLELSEDLRYAAGVGGASVVIGGAVLGVVALKAYGGLMLARYAVGESLIATGVLGAAGIAASRWGSVSVMDYMEKRAYGNFQECMGICENRFADLPK